MFVLLSAIAASYGGSSVVKESRKNKDKEEEEQVEKKEAEEPCSRVASGQAALVGRWQFLTMVKIGSLLSVGLCRFMEFME